MAPDNDYRTYQSERLTFWDAVARKSDQWRGLGGFYHRRLQQIYRQLIPAGRRVLELGCGTGDLLAAVNPACGIGVDFSEEMVARARKRHPSLSFLCADAHEIERQDPFDLIILSDIVNDLWDVQSVFERLRLLSHPRTRLIINCYSRLWELPLGLTRRLGLAGPLLRQNWLTISDLRNLLSLAGFETLREWQEILCPVRIPLIDRPMNRILVRLWPLHHGALVNMLVARPVPAHAAPRPSVSVIIPARNEEGNVRRILDEMPDFGAPAELIFVEGNSRDRTFETIKEAIATHTIHACFLIKQQGKGKGDAVRRGFDQAQGDVLMILDADLTVRPGDLTRFRDALIGGKGEFINGVRLVYPRGKQAMRFFNLIGNKLFAVAFSWLLGQPLKDTLCGTKALWRSDYLLIQKNRAYFGDFDPFGDFDLLFGAARLGLKIVDLPIRYHDRTYGTTNIRRWKHGWILLRMVLFAARKIKFI